MPVGQNKYSDRDKAAALAFLDFRESQTGERNIKKAAELLDIPERTLNDWENKRRGINEDIARLREESKKGLADLIEEKVTNIIAASDEKIDKASLQQVWTSAGIGVDKMQLLRGKATNISGTESDLEEAKRILDWHRERSKDFTEVQIYTLLIQPHFPQVTAEQLQIKEEVNVESKEVNAAQNPS